ncbi:MAG: nucleotide exchange factor GrpE [Balneolales bacterium]
MSIKDKAYKAENFEEQSAEHPSGIHYSAKSSSGQQSDFDASGKSKKNDNFTDSKQKRENEVRHETGNRETNKNSQPDKSGAYTSDTNADDESRTDAPDAQDMDRNDLNVEELQEELEQARNSMLRKAAELDNFKKRTQKERQRIFEEAKSEAVSSFLPIREDLKRSLEAMEDRKVEKGFLEGLKLVMDNFDRVLAQFDVEPIEETGIPFDVDMHDAMLTQSVDDGSVESNTVIQILEPGYRMGDRVIKHAKVIVSQ